MSNRNRMWQPLGSHQVVDAFDEGSEKAFKAFAHVGFLPWVWDSTMNKSHGLTLATTLVVLLTLGASSAFAADVNKCVSSNGKVTYTDAPCPADTATTKALSTPVDQSAMCPEGLEAVGCIEMTDLKVIEHFEKNSGLHSGPYTQAVVTRIDANKCVMFDAHESVKLVKHWDNRRTLVKRASGGEYWVSDKWLKPGKCP